MSSKLKTFSQITGGIFEANKDWWRIGFKNNTDDVIKLYDKHSDGSIFSPVKRGSYGDGLIEVANYGKSFGFSFRDDGEKQKIKDLFIECMDNFHNSHINDPEIFNTSDLDFGVNIFNGHNTEYTLIMWIANFKGSALAKLYLELLRHAIDRGDLAPTFINQIKGSIKYG